MVKGYEYFVLVKSQSRRRHLMNRAGNTIFEITFPDDGKVRSRTIVSRSRARPTGKYPSFKMGRMIQWESHNELNAFRLLDANPAVTDYHEQPLTIQFVLNGENHIHFPDVLVQRGQSRELWEIKPRQEALRFQYIERTRFLEATLPSFGYQYRMVLADELSAQPRLSNVLMLLKYGREPVGDVEREHVRNILGRLPSINWAAAVRGDLGPRGRALLCRLALDGVLTVDIETAEISGATEFRQAAIALVEG